MPFLIHCFSRLERLFPARLRERFGDELESVYQTRLEVAARRGWWAVVQIFLQEFRTLLPLLFREWWLSCVTGWNEKRDPMQKLPFEDSLPDESIPASWRITALGLIPFIWMPLNWLVIHALVLFDIDLYAKFPNDSLSSHLLLGLFLFFCFIAIVSWVKGFPAWTFPYWIWVMMFSFYLPSASLPGLTLFGYQFGNQLLGMLAMVPLLLVIGVSLALTRSMRPFFQWANGMKQDWTRVSFGLYAGTPLWMRLVFEGVQGEDALLVLFDLIIAAGALVYLRSANRRWTASAMFLASLLVLIPAYLFLGNYWKSQSETWFRNPVMGFTLGSVFSILYWLGIVFSPWIFKQVYRVTQPVIERLEALK